MPRQSRPRLSLVPDVTIPAEDAYLRRLGQMIKLIRKRLRLGDQAAFGELVGRDKTTISRWENGKTSLSAYDLSLLQRALDVPADWLLDPTDSLGELDERIEQLRVHRLATDAMDLAASDVEAELAQQGDDAA